MNNINLKKMKKCIAETENMMQALKTGSFWLPAEADSESWAMIPNVVNSETLKIYVPVFTDPKEFSKEYLERFGMMETDLCKIKEYLLDGCDGIVLNPFTDSVIIPVNYLS